MNRKTLPSAHTIATAIGHPGPANLDDPVNPVYSNPCTEAPKARLFPMSSTIRAATATDLEAACRIAVQAWAPIHESFRAMLGEELHGLLSPDWQQRKAEQIRRHFADHPEWMLVVEEDGQVIGFLTYRLDQDRCLGTIGNNAIAPGWQGRGLGSRMYERALDLFRGAGMLYAAVQTGLDEGHAPARRAYEKVCFDIERPDVTYYQKL